MCLCIFLLGLIHSTYNSKSTVEEFQFVSNNGFGGACQALLPKS